MKLITINLIDHSTGNAYITNTFEEDITDINGDITFDTVSFLFYSIFNLNLKESECFWGIINDIHIKL